MRYRQHFFLLTRLKRTEKKKTIIAAAKNENLPAFPSHPRRKQRRILVSVTNHHTEDSGDVNVLEDRGCCAWSFNEMQLMKLIT